MEMRETNILRSVRNGLFLLLWAATAACFGGREVAGDDVVSDNLPLADGTTVTDLGVTEKVAVADIWDEVEFYTDFMPTAYFEDWDVDDNSFLDEGEFTTSVFQLWDTDKDGMIEEIELSTAVTDFGLSGAAWETDSDGYIEMAGFETGFAGTGWFDAWDTDNDNRISEREYAAGVFRVWDRNDDNVLDETEYRRYLH